MISETQLTNCLYVEQPNTVTLMTMISMLPIFYRDAASFIEWKIKPINEAVAFQIDCNDSMTDDGFTQIEFLSDGMDCSADWDKGLDRITVSVQIEEPFSFGKFLKQLIS